MKIINCIEELLDYIRSHSKVYCYGAGKYGRLVRALLSKYEINISGFIVSDKKNYCHEILEIPVFSVDEIGVVNEDDIGVIVSTSETIQPEIIKNLIEFELYDYCLVSDFFIDSIEKSTFFDHQYKKTNTITIFCFHRVADLPLDTWRLSVSPSLFDKQVEYIKNNYYIIKSGDEWNDLKTQNAAVITFDDGYYDSYEHALPILEKHEVPATFFICTGNIDTEKEFWWDELERIIFYSDEKISHFNLDGLDYDISSANSKAETCYKLHPLLKKMHFENRNECLENLSILLKSGSRSYCKSLDSEQLLKLSGSSLITIGGHTVTHSCLAKESLSDQEWEITESKKIIEDIIGRKLEVFSYPFGQLDDFTADTVEIAKKTGYKKIFAAFEGLSNSAFQNGYIPRINIGQEKDYFDSIRLLRYYETIYGDV